MIYDEIYEKFYPVIVKYSFLRLKDEYYAEEISNETFALLWQRWDTMDFITENMLLSWLYKVAGKKMKEHRRKNPYNYIPIDNSNIRNTPDIHTAIEYEEIDAAHEDKKYHEYMSEVRKQLPPQDLILFDKVVIQALPYKQIALELDTTVAAIKMRWLRLKTRLRKIVQDITGEEL